jgi:hypothetical protein
MKKLNQISMAAAAARKQNVFENEESSLRLKTAKYENEESYHSQWPVSYKQSLGEINVKKAAHNGWQLIGSRNRRIGAGGVVA